MLKYFNKQGGFILTLLFSLFFTGVASAGEGSDVLPGYPVTAPAPKAARGDSVQVLLRRLSRSSPELVGYIPETQRYYLLSPRRDALPEWLHTRLQDAFYYDIGETCRFYGWKYLADWRVLAGKCARETFWGTSFLCNRTFNYFGIWRKNKPWVCEVFNFCETFSKDDPAPTDFVVFPDFESSLWMFIHTIYSFHFLERLPDQGERVQEAINYERMYGTRYWAPNFYDRSFAYQLPGTVYTDEELIFSWSEHQKNNLCANCSRQSDRDWLAQLVSAAGRARND